MMVSHTHLSCTGVSDCYSVAMNWSSVNRETMGGLCIFSLV